MTTLHTILTEIAAQVSGVTRGIFVDKQPLKVEVAPGYPPEPKLQEVARRENRLAVVAVYDRKMGRDSTRWSPRILGEVVQDAGLTTAISLPRIAAGGTATITLGGTPKPQDAVSAVLCNTALIPQKTAAQVVSAGAADTPATMATALAAAVNADEVLSTWVSAAVSGAVVTLTNHAAGFLNLQSYAGAVACRTTEIGRRMRQIAVMIWTRNEDARIAVTDPVETLIAVLARNFGLTFCDGTSARILYVSDCYIEDPTLEDVTRRDFYLSADYGITAQDALYAVLAPIPEYAVD